jgi:hypothetical protein
MKNIVLLMLLAVGIVSTNAMENENIEGFVRNAMRFGTCVERTMCVSAGRDFPTAWSLEGKVVSAKHKCTSDCSLASHFIKPEKSLKLDPNLGCLEMPSGILDLLFANERSSSRSTQNFLQGNADNGLEQLLSMNTENLHEDFCQRQHATLTDLLTIQLAGANQLNQDAFQLPAFRFQAPAPLPVHPLQVLQFDFAPILLDPVDFYVPDDAVTPKPGFDTSTKPQAD